MSEHTTTTPPATSGGGDNANEAVVVNYEGARRRRRRRRRKQGVAETPVQRLHLLLLCLVALALIFALIGPAYRHHFIESIRRFLPNFTQGFSRWGEIIALVVAALILVYLTPGVEERVLALFGIKRDRRGKGLR